jgi:hypothetical protein
MRTRRAALAAVSTLHLHQETIMKILTPSMRHIVAVLALTAASTSAFAQSADYRRGYDEGYAAGQRDSRGDRGDRGDRERGQDWGIRIEEAEYGTGNAMCNARRAVRDAAERNGGVIPVGNQLCGDPAISRPKRLNVVYRCGNSEPVRVSARENETMRLSCRR